METETLLTTAEAAKRLEICPDTLRQLARAGKLKYAMVIGRRGQRLFAQAEVEKLWRERQAGKLIVNDQQRR